MVVRGQLYADAVDGGNPVLPLTVRGQLVDAVARGKPLPVQFQVIQLHIIRINEVKIIG